MRKASIAVLLIAVVGWFAVFSTGPQTVVTLDDPGNIQTDTPCTFDGKSHLDNSDPNCNADPITTTTTATTAPTTTAHSLTNSATSSTSDTSDDRECDNNTNHSHALGHRDYSEHNNYCRHKHLMESSFEIGTDPTGKIDTTPTETTSPRRTSTTTATPTTTTTTTTATPTTTAPTTTTAAPTTTTTTSTTLPTGSATAEWVGRSWICEVGTSPSLFIQFKVEVDKDRQRDIDSDALAAKQTYGPQTANVNSNRKQTNINFDPCRIPDAVNTQTAPRFSQVFDVATTWAAQGSTGEFPAGTDIEQRFGVLASQQSSAVLLTSSGSAGTTLAAEIDAAAPGVWTRFTFEGYWQGPTS